MGTKAAAEAGSELGKGLVEGAIEAEKAAPRRSYHGPFCCCSRPYDSDQERWNGGAAEGKAKFENPLASADVDSDDDDDDE
jgi:hypothetical protein